MEYATYGVFHPQEKLSPIAIWNEAKNYDMSKGIGDGWGYGNGRGIGTNNHYASINGLGQDNGHGQGYGNGDGWASDEIIENVYGL